MLATQEVVMLSDEFNEVYSHARWGLLLRGLFSLAIGIVIITRPMNSAAAFAILIAVWALIVGITEVADGIHYRSVLPHWWLILFAGLVSIAFSIAAFYYYPGLSLAFAVIWVAWWLIVSGFFGIYVALQERKIGVSWGWPFAFGVLFVLGGIYAVMRPSVTLAAILGLIAAIAIIGGVFQLVGFFRLGAVKSELADAIGARRASTTRPTT
jgi:uncharacterized membrane protein HdeD (DUF308 family)